MEESGPWIEVGDRVFTRRYRFWDQQIGVVLGDGAALVVDTRLTLRQAREVLDDLRVLTRDPVSIVVNTHWHHDHAFGNHAFRVAGAGPVGTRPAIWGHERCGARLLEHGERVRAAVAEALPDLAADLAEVVIDPPDHSFAEAVRISIGGPDGRRVWLRHLGRGHTDTDLVVEVPDAGVLFAGDLIEEGAAPSFGDAYPLDWPETASRLLDLVRGPVVPGHGTVVDRVFVEGQVSAFLEIARLGREVHAARMSLDAAIAASPFDADASRAPLERTLAQLRGDLD